MRLKEDSNSWRASGIIHRDNRHINSDETLRFKRRKNTRRYCGGKINREHTLIREQRGYVRAYTYTVVKCTTCRKEFYWRMVRDVKHVPLKIMVDQDYSHDFIKVRYG